MATPHEDVVNEATRAAEESEAETISLKRAANTLARRFRLSEPFANIEDTAASRTSVAIRADHFVNFNAPAAAARAYLELRGKNRGAATIEDIYEALRRGGYDFGTPNDNEGKGFLKVALAKDQNVHRIDNGPFGVSYGLVAWYPDAKKPAADESLAVRRFSSKGRKVVRGELPPDFAAVVARDDDGEGEEA